ncbi:YoaK family protein [Silvibacterium acidisoli]|uniref:YoaK family protein n=1 Tax=Acidobacteriaceae bacterium ZG23-2 TaxID=2883246 RepID=UPI00406CB819
MTPFGEPASEEHSASQLDTAALLATAGGYLDGFTYVGHGHVFANAMTGNVVLLAIDIIGKDWRDSLRHLLPIIAFFLGVSAAKALLWSQWKILRWPRRVLLICEIAAFTGLSFLPQHISDFWITISIAFIASAQVETFRKVHQASFNSTFTTGNLRTLSASIFDWFVGNHNEQNRQQIVDFAVICLLFFLGAAAGALLVQRFGNHALWGAILLLALALWRICPAGGTKLAPAAD